MEKLKLLDLFSGIGGFSLGLERTGGFETVAFCEYDEKAQKVLKKHWPDVPIFKDVRNMEYDGTVDIITGGYPCQPFSFAGKRKGAEDDRHLWPAMFKLIQKHRPTWVIGENVAGHINMGLDSVLTDLESENYSTRTFVIPACALNAPHRRDRLWIVGYSEHDGSSSAEVGGGTYTSSHNNEEGQIEAFELEGTSGHSDDEIVVNTDNKRCEKLNISEKPEKQIKFDRGYDETLADTNLQRCKRPEETRNDGKNKQKPDDKQLRGCGAAYGSEETMADTKCGVGEALLQREQKILREKNKRWQTDGFSAQNVSAGELWAVEPNVGRVANGIPRRMDRLRQLGNAVVPQIPEILGNAILEAEGLTMKRI